MWGLGSGGIQKGAILGGDEGIAEELREEIVEDFSREWSEVVEASVTKRLSTRRASERLTKARVAVSLDMPGKRPKGWKPKGVRVRYTSRAKASLIAEAEAIVRADSLSCSLENGKLPTHAAVWDRAGRVTVLRSSIAGDGCGWMHSQPAGE